MKKLVVFGNLLFFTLVLRAQSDYFLFIQSENNQPYYVQTGGKTLSSSAIGHLIISGLRDSAYDLNIGFPKNQFPEQVFQVRINKRDAGYQLKNMGSEGWALFNMQTLQLIKAQPVESKKQTVSYGDIKKTDHFSTLMAGLVNDSAVLYTSIAKAEPPKESSKTSLPDTPLTNTDVVKRQDLQKKDSPVTKTELVKPDEAVPVKDSVEINAVTKQQETLKKDTVVIQPAIAGKQEVLKNDTVAIKTEISKKDEPLKKDTGMVKTEVTMPKEVVKKDTPINRPVVAPTVQAAIENEKTPDSLAAIQTKPAEITSKELKPLIVWFSETKTSAGTELVFFDMSSADKIDTIKILIVNEETAPKELNGKEGEKNINGDKAEDQKTGAGKLIGKLFGKKDKSKPAGNNEDDKAEPSKKTSTIKVTTVERKKVDSSLASNNDGKKKEDLSIRETGTIKNDEKKKEGQKNGVEKFIGKIFGRKNNAASTKSDTAGAGPGKTMSTVKVTTVESQKTKEPAVTQNKEPKSKEQEGVKETESIQANSKQEENQKTGAGKFIGKIFGKKNSQEQIAKDTARKVEASPKLSSVKVTTVDSGNQSVSVPKAEKTKPVLTNSDCRTFATDSDVDKLRVRMIGEKDADGQVTEARKYFKTKCFSTKQIRALSELFRTDEGKYKLFDAAYPYVSDAFNFKDLAALLAEEYYINRFKAMVRM
ncbi:MAG: hypothetical protein H7122_16015 [Chitinophagaceae bacterium]|nr:hypothetical protein [Chitinophagaceae bacterium]